MTKKIKLALVGSSGRMGQTILECLDSRFELVWSQGDKLSFDGLVESTAQVIIDFSQPKATLGWSKLFKGKKMPKALICTTGFSAKELSSLQTQLKGQSYAIVPNTSIGVLGTKKALEALSAIFDERYQFTLIESHHIHKKDSPSGTAIQLRDAIDNARPKNSKRKKTEVFSFRAGTDPGTHRVEILGPHEKIVITHSAENRKLFAEGALHLAQKFFESRKTGALYGIDAIIGK